MKAKHLDQYYNQILAELRNSCSEGKITQTDIGAALGIKQSAVSSLLNGKSRISLDQFLILTELVSISPQDVLQRASNRSTEVVPMTTEIENTLYRSETHVLAYCAATRPISVSDLVHGGIPESVSEAALDDLVRVGLLEKKRSKYVQKHPSRTYRAQSRSKLSAAHQQIVSRSWQLFDRRIQDREWIASKFNAFMVDRFTKSQTKEIEAAMWKVYEKIQAYSQENSSQGYTTEESMPLWNFHLMMVTPLEAR